MGDNLESALQRCLPVDTSPAKLGDAPWMCHVPLMDLQKTLVWWPPWEDIP